MPSITIIDQPGNIMPVYNNIVITVDSTHKTYCNFKYVCDIYVNGNFVTRIKLFPAGVNGYASFKINRILEDFISHDLHNNLFGFAHNPNSICSYQLYFGEEYDSSVGCVAGTTIYPNILATYNKYAINAALQYKEWPTWDYTLYASYDPLIRQWLTNTPDNVMIGIGQQSVLNFMNLDLDMVKYCFIIVYDADNNIINTGYFVNPYSTISSIADIIQSVGVGPDNINNATLGFGTQPLIIPKAAYYTIQLANSGFSVTSKTFKFQIDKRTSKWEPNRLWWLNRLGGFDSYAYTMKDKVVINSKRTEMQKLMGDLNSTPHWTYNISDRGRVTLSVDASQTDNYTSNWLTQCEANWQEELFTSPEVYMSKVNTPICFTNMGPGNSYE